MKDYTILSHELKTPINIILASCHMLRGYDHIQTPLLDDVEKQSYIILKQVNDLIDLAKIDTGFFHNKKGRYNLVQVVESSIEVVGGYLREIGWGCYFDTEEEEMIVFLNPYIIERLLFNILAEIVCNGKSRKIEIVIKKEDKYNVYITCDTKDGRDAIKSSSIIQGLLKSHGIQLECYYKEQFYIIKLGLQQEILNRIDGIHIWEVEEGNYQQCRMEFAHI